MERVAIIGAGVAGLSAARVLADAGRDVTVFEKSRGRGGRMSTRRADEWRFDHGAQYFTARVPEFGAEVERWVAGGAAARWDGRFVELPSGDEVGGERYVGLPGMSGVGAFLASGLSPKLRSRVTAVRRDGAGWVLETEDGDGNDGGGNDGGGNDGDGDRQFDTVLVATPAEQAAPLLAAARDLAEAAGAVRTLPCWAVMLGFDRRVDLPFDGALVRDGPLAWIARDSSKPGRPRPGDGEAWVLHASPEWSASRLALDPDDVTAGLLRVLEVLVPGRLPRVAFQSAHRWMYARTADALGAPFLWDAARRIGACGDWCLGARVEYAFLSGRALAAAALGATA